MAMLVHLSLFRVPGTSPDAKPVTLIARERETLRRQQNAKAWNLICSCMLQQTGMEICESDVTSMTVTAMLLFTPLTQKASEIVY